MIYPRSPGLFATALVVAAVIVFGTYWLSGPLRKPERPEPPDVKATGLSLVEVSALTAPHVVPTVPPKWEPDPKVPDTPVPPAPEPGREMLPPAASIEGLALLRTPSGSESLMPGRVLDSGAVDVERVEDVDWSLLISDIEPPRTELTKPVLSQEGLGGGVPLPALERALSPRVLPELLMNGDSPPPSHPASTGVPFEP